MVYELVLDQHDALKGHMVRYDEKGTWTVQREIQSEVDAFTRAVRGPLQAGADLRPKSSLQGMGPDERLLWHTLNKPDVHMVLLSGRAGAGKSCLLHKFIASLHGREYTIPTVDTSPPTSGSSSSSGGSSSSTSSVQTGDVVVDTSDGGRNVINEDDRGFGMDTEPSFEYKLLAPTGIAAYNVGGTTIHSALGLGLADGPVEEIWRKLHCNRRKEWTQKTFEFLTVPRVYIIDEISMVSPDLFCKLDFLIRSANEVLDVPFAGRKLVAVGDFTQLGPVIKESELLSKEPKFVFQTDVWQRLRVGRIILDRSYRQSEGSQFSQILSEVRLGTLSDESLEALQSRVGVTHDAQVNHNRGHVNGGSDDTDTKQPNNRADRASGADAADPSKTSIRPLTLFAYVKSVTSYNTKCLQTLSERTGARIRKFAPILKAESANPDRPMELRDQREAEALISKRRFVLEKNFPVFYLHVCCGAQVMMCSNVYRDHGVVNGSLGIVTRILEQDIEVVFVCQKRKTRTTIRMPRTKFTYRVGKTGSVTMVQFPLKLAWSCTIHKTQGLTLDSISVNASGLFAGGHCYTALSRVRKLSDLFLIDFDPNIHTDRDAVSYELGYHGTVASATTVGGDGGVRGVKRHASSSSDAHAAGKRRRVADTSD